MRTMTLKGNMKFRLTVTADERVNIVDIEKALAEMLADSDTCDKGFEVEGCDMLDNNLEVEDSR